MFNIKNKNQLNKLRDAGKILSETFNILLEKVDIGISTNELDIIANDIIRKNNARPAFLNYNNFPKSICTSINEELVHGIPSDRILKDGDLLTIDIGVKYQGFFVDRAQTIGIGNISQEDQDLINVTEKAFWESIVFFKEGNRLGNFQNTLQSIVEEAGYHLPNNYCSHEIGRNLHESLVLNHGSFNSGPRLKEGMVFAIEPMVSLVKETYIKEDGWTVAMAHNKKSAHFEHTLIVTKSGPEIITQ